MASMKMEFIKSGSLDCPLIRLFEFKTSEAQSLRRIALQLAKGRTQSVLLHKAEGIEAIDWCQLTLSRGEKDRGTFETGPMEFAWFLTGGGWLSVSGSDSPVLANWLTWLSMAVRPGQDPDSNFARWKLVVAKPLFTGG
jgi:hypothetical protein